MNKYIYCFLINISFIYWFFDCVEGGEDEFDFLFVFVLWVIALVYSGGMMMESDFNILSKNLDIVYIFFFSIIWLVYLLNVFLGKKVFSNNKF